MIGSTAGTWLNYATTIIFQVVFAAAFGASATASAFFIALVSAISLANILNGTVHVIAVPRLVTDGGAFHRGQLRLMAGVAVVAIIAAVAIIALADRLTSSGSGAAGLSADFVRATAAYFVTRVVATLLSTIALARGHRFWPAASPAIPSIAAVLYLLLSRDDPSATTTMALLAIGSVLQVLVLVLASIRRFRVVPGEIEAVRGVTLATAAQLALLMVLPPLQRIMSSVDSASGAATAHYGLQGLQTAQQLLISGLTVAAFADWSRLRSRSDLGSALARTTAFGSLLLVVAAAVGTVAAPTIVRVLFQRGSFTSSDTEAVVAVVRLGVVGFVAEGVGLIVVQAIVATRQNWIAIRIGVFRFLITAPLTIAGGLLAGANGVAIATSIGAVGTLVLIWPAAFRLVTVPDLARDTLKRAGLAAAGVVLVAALVLVLVPSWPEIAQAIMVLVAAGVFIVALRLPVRQWRLS